MRVDALSCSKDGAGDGVRTRDVQLGKLAFCQLNYSRSNHVVILTKKTSCRQGKNQPV